MSVIFSRRVLIDSTILAPPGEQVSSCARALHAGRCMTLGLRRRDGTRLKARVFDLIPFTIKLLTFSPAKRIIHVTHVRCTLTEAYSSCLPKLRPGLVKRCRQPHAMLSLHTWVLNGKLQCSLGPILCLLLPSSRMRILGPGHIGISFR